MSRSLNISRGEAVALARALEATGAGQFVLGRRGSKSRFAWHYSCISLGRVAAGEMTELEAPKDPELEETEEAGAGATQGLGSLTIADAKRRLSASLGVVESNIEILVRG